jgi:20S proteasome subunit alpha 3
MEDNQFSNNIFLLEENIVCAITGFNPDAQVLIDYARIEAQKYRRLFQEPIPIKNLLNIICEIKQQFTQTENRRPFGTSLLIGGWDCICGFQLFKTEPSGNFSEWKAVAIGNNSFFNQIFLNLNYNKNWNLKNSMEVLTKLFKKKLEKLNFSYNIDILILKHDDKQKLIFDFLNIHQLDNLFKMEKKNFNI